MPQKQHKVNLNTASPEELKALPEIGEVIAEEIINRRMNIGPFQNREDVLEVRGISERLLDEFAERIAY